jgi:glycerophosphoryl diester phosphodiesterase
MTWIDHELRLYGHRGASALLPENTMESFRQALADGATALELDVHLSRDGHVVVAHDPDGRRVAGCGDAIRDCTLEQLSHWDVGASFAATGETPARMPTLIEVLQSFPGVPISVDLKPNEPRIADSVLEVLRTHDAEPLVTVGSFHGPILHRLRRLGYRGPTALTRAEVAALRLLPATVSDRRIHGQAAMIPRRSGPVRLDAEAFIHRLRALGLRADYWVVNDPDEARTLLGYGATGIVTDDPAIIAPVFAEFR